MTYFLDSLDKIKKNSDDPFLVICSKFLISLGKNHKNCRNHIKIKCCFLTSTLPAQPDKILKNSEITFFHIKSPCLLLPPYRALPKCPHGQSTPALNHWTIVVIHWKRKEASELRLPETLVIW